MEEKEKIAVHFSLGESLIIMMVMFGILGTMIIGMKMAPQVPILFVFTLLMFYGHFRGVFMG